MSSAATTTAWGDAATCDVHLSDSLLPAALPGDLILGPEQRSLVASLEDTYAALLRGKGPAYNPIVIHGPCGVGKTQLLRAICDSLRPSLGKAQVQYLAASEYAQELAEAIDADDVPAWRDRHRAAQLFVLDDFEHLAGKELAQDELARTIDYLVAEARQVIVIAHQSLGRAKNFQPNLLARLAAGLAVPMALPQQSAREGILRASAAMKGARVSESAYRLLAASLAEPPTALCGAITYLYTAGAGAEIDADAVRAYLAERGNGNQLSVRDIAAATAKHFALSLSDLRGASRRKTIVAARGVAMWLARQITGGSLEQIGEQFGGRDHTTVLHACRRTEGLAINDCETRRAVDEIRAALGVSR